MDFFQRSGYNKKQLWNHLFLSSSLDPWLDKENYVLYIASSNLSPFL